MKFFKKQLLALVLMLGGVQFAQALTLDDITPETIATIPYYEIEKLLQSLDVSPRLYFAHKIAKSITKETIVKIDSSLIDALLKVDKGLAKQFAELIDKQNIVTIDKYTIYGLLNADKNLAKQFAALIDKETIFKIDSEFIDRILSNDKDAVKHFATLIDINKETVKRFTWIPHIIRYRIQEDKSLSTTFAHLIDKEIIVEAKESSAKIIEYCLAENNNLVNYFVNLIDKKTILTMSPYVIKNLIKADKNLIQYFTDLIDKEMILKDNSSYYFALTILNLIEADKNLLQHFLNLINQQPITSVNPDIIQQLIIEDKTLVSHFTKSINKTNILKVDSYIVYWIIYADKSLIPYFAHLIDKEMLIKHDRFELAVIEHLVEKDKNLAQQFAALVDKETILKIEPDNINFLLSMADKDENLKKELAQQFAQLIDKKMLVQINDTVICQILKANHNLSTYFAELIDKETITKINPKTINNLLNANPSLIKQFTELMGIAALKNHTLIESQLFASEKINTIQSLTKQLNISSNIIFEKNDLQSIQHFDIVENALNKDVFKELKDRGITESDRAMLLKLIHKSRLEEKKGNFTFIHAQVRSFLPLSDIFKRLVELCENNGNSYGDGHYPLRFTKPGGAFALKDQNIADIMQHGLYENSSTKDFEQDGVYTLCMNGYLFGSAEISGSYSLSYWLKNDDQSKRKGLTLNARKMLEVYGLETYYDRYQKEFELLWYKVTKDGQRGNIVLLSLTPEQVKKWVYPSDGNRCKSYFTIDGKKTDDVALVLKTLKTDPKKLSVNDLRELHYCLVLSDQALDPVNGVKIYPFTSDESYVRAWREKLDALFVKIKQDIAKDKQAQPQQLQPQVTQVMQNKTSSNECMPTSTPTNKLTVNRRLAVLAGHLQVGNQK